jgi:hypothetical protein
MLLAFTFVTERPKLHAAEAGVEVAHHHYVGAGSSPEDASADEATIRALCAGMGPDLLRIASGGVPAHDAEPAHTPGEHQPPGGHP